MPANNHNVIVGGQLLSSIPIIGPVNVAFHPAIAFAGPDCEGAHLPTVDAFITVSVAVLIRGIIAHTNLHSWNAVDGNARRFDPFNDS
jgi:hypothetical protein